MFASGGSTGDVGEHDDIMFSAGEKKVDATIALDDIVDKTGQMFLFSRWIRKALSPRYIFAGLDKAMAAHKINYTFYSNIDGPGASTFVGEQSTRRRHGCVGAGYVGMISVNDRGHVTMISGV
jgi:hypothetical protein